MENENSIEYLIELKDTTRNRYIRKPQKPLQAAAMQVEKPKSNNNLVSYDVIMGLYLEAAKRVTARVRPLPYVPEAEDMLNESWRCCLLGWSDLEHFKATLKKWETLTGGCDYSPQQEILF